MHRAGRVYRWPGRQSRPSGSYRFGCSIVFRACVRRRTVWPVCRIAPAFAAWRSRAFESSMRRGQTQRRKGKGGVNRSLTVGQADTMDRSRAEGGGVNPKQLSPLNCVLAEKVTADFINGARRPLDQDRLVAGPSQHDRRGSAGWSAADDYRVPTHRRNGMYQATNACCLVMPAWRSNASHSARVKARAIEIWPSSRTKRCQKARRARIGNP